MRRRAEAVESEEELEDEMIEEWRGVRKGEMMMMWRRME